VANEPEEIGTMVLAEFRVACCSERNQSAAAQNSKSAPPTRVVVSGEVEAESETVAAIRNRVGIGKGAVFTLISEPERRRAGDHALSGLDKRPASESS